MTLTAQAAAPWRYGAVAITLHWVLAVALSCTTALAWYMMSVEQLPGSAVYFDLHKSVGLLIATLVLVRLAWRLTHKPAALPASVAREQAWLSLMVQRLLYLLMLLMPLTGILGTAYKATVLPFFGLMLPSPVSHDKVMARFYFSMHGWLIWVLIGLVALHTLAALKHRFIDKDAVFNRMWPWRARPGAR